MASRQAQSALNQLLVPRSAHFHRSATVTAVAPMPLVAIEPLTRAATVAHENVGLLLSIARRKGHGRL